MNHLETPPISDRMPAFEFPKFERHSLGNGIKVYLVEDNSQALLNVQFLFGRGAAEFDAPALCSLATAMLTHGTRFDSAEEISEKVDDIGAYISSGSDMDESSAGITCLADYSAEAMDILASCINEPAFGADEVERLKKKRISNLNQSLASPDYLSTVACASQLFAGHPYGKLLAGSESRIKSIDSQQCRAAYERVLGSARKCIIVSGCFDKDNILNRLDKHYGGLPADASALPPAAPAKPDGNVIAVADKEDAVQSTIKAGMMFIDRNNPDYPLAHVVNTIFGGYFLSRLNYLLREVHGYTYGVYSYINSFRYASALMVQTNVNAGVTRAAIEDIFAEMERISRQAIPEEETSRAVQYMLGQFARSMETPRQVASLLQSVHTYGLKEDYYVDFINKVKSAGPENLRGVQEKYFKPENIAIGVAGSRDELMKELEGLCGLKRFIHES